jgi:hypothetical protein
MLRAGKLTNPSDRNAVGAANILAEEGWWLVRHPAVPGLVLRRELYPRELGTITVTNDPGQVSYSGHAVGWGNTPLAHFRIDRTGEGGVLHPDAVGTDLGTPRGLARAAKALYQEPGMRLLGVITLAADEGEIPKRDFDWHDTDHLDFAIGGSMALTAGGHDADSLREQWKRAAGIPPGDTDLGRHAIAVLDEIMIANNRTLWPVNGHSEWASTPVPDILPALGFSDESWGNDSGAKSALVVAGPMRPANANRREINWGHWPELESNKDQYELSVWSLGLHPGDQERGDGVRYAVYLGTQEANGANDIEIGEAQDEQGLAMILQELGLRPEAESNPGPDYRLRRFERTRATGSSYEDLLRHEAELVRAGQRPQVAELQRRLAAANGRRRTRALSWDDLVALLAEVEETGTPSSWCIPVSVSYKFIAWTTVALAVRVGDTVVVDVGRSTAKRCSPGRMWPELQPWREYWRVPAPSVEAKIGLWAQDPKRVVLPRSTVLYLWERDR